MYELTLWLTTTMSLRGAQRRGNLPGQGMFLQCNSVNGAGDCHSPSGFAMTWLSLHLASNDTYNPSFPKITGKFSDRIASTGLE